MRKSIFKNNITVLILIILMMLPALTSCHGSRSLDEFTMPEAFDKDKNYELNFWAKNDTNLTQVGVYERAIEEFESLFPNIKINLRLYTDYGRIYNDVITNIATGTTPNICITYPDHIATYLTGDNTVVPLELLMNDEKYGLGGSEVPFDAPTVSEIVPKFLEEGKIGGVQYALPYMRSSEVCYVNRDYVEALGFTLPDVLTWDFMFEVARAAVEKNEDGSFKINGQMVMLPIIYKSTDNMMIQYLKQSDAEYSNEDGDVLIFNDTTEEFLFNIADLVKVGGFSTFSISSYPANFLNAGQCIFAIDSTAGATWMGSKAPLLDISEDTIVDFETVVMLPPQVDAENIQMISQGPSFCLFNKRDNGEVLASWLFLQYMLTNDIQISYATTEGYVPVTSKAQESAEYLDYLSRSGENGDYYYDIKITATKMLLDNIENTFVTPVYNGSASLRQASGQLIENVTKSVRRSQTIDKEYIEDMYEKVIALYRLDEKAGQTKKADLGKLPVESVVLIGTLFVVWLFIIIYVIFDAVKKRKNFIK